MDEFVGGGEKGVGLTSKGKYNGEVGCFVYSLAGLLTTSSGR